MIHLHATQKLLKRLPLNQEGRLAATPRSQFLFEQHPLENNPLSGWHGNLINAQRRNTLLLVHDTTRFPLILPALTKPDWIELNDRFADALINTLYKCGATDAQCQTAQAYLRPLQADTQCRRSEQGTLHRMKDEVEHLLWHNQTDIAALNGYRTGAWLADTPRTVKGKGVLWPQREMLALLETLSTSLA